MSLSLALVGFGEAAQAFAGHGDWRDKAYVYDIATETPALAAAKRDDYAKFGVIGCESLLAATADRTAVISLVTANAALDVAQNLARSIRAGALFFDMNSVAPDTKRAAAAAVETAHGRYVDVAVMSPVYPRSLATPLLLSGPHAGTGADALRELGFSNVRVVAGDVGRASAIKMIRSVMVKGLEALTAECFLAAAEADVVDEVLNSLGGDWPKTANYNLDRMLVHGTRRAAEMREVVKTLGALGVDPAMSGATVTRQEAVGALGLTAPPDTLGAKLSAISQSRKAQAA